METTYHNIFMIYELKIILNILSYFKYIFRNISKI